MRITPNAALLPSRTTSRRRVSQTRRMTQKGGALLAVMWMSAALAAIGFAVSARVLAETDHVSAIADGLRAQYLATGSVERAIQWMVWGPARRNPDGSTRFWQPNTPRLFMNYSSGDVVVEMIPESSKLDINRASAEQLFQVVAAVAGNPAEARQIANSIIDWRTPGGGGSSSGGSGVRGFGQTSQPFNFQYGPTFQPRHASFEEIEELLFVRGVTPELFYGNFVSTADGATYATGGLRDALSVWGSLGPFEINTVSPAVLQMLGATPAAIEQLVAQRALRPLSSLTDAPNLGSASGRLSTSGIQLWTIRATARLRNPDGTASDVVRSASATVKYFSDNKHFTQPVHVLRFRDNDWSQFTATPPAISTGIGGLAQ